MKMPEIPDNEQERLNELYKLNVLDTESEHIFDNLTALASSVAGCPISLISLVDGKRQWFKAKTGISVDETEREISFCGHVINQDSEKVFEVNDASKDEVFSDNPLVTGDSNVKFYAGAPLITSNGYKVGTLCVIDHQAKQLTSEQKYQLECISKQVVALLESESKNKAMEDKFTSNVNFISRLSHEIRTSLTSISGYSDILSEELKSVNNEVVTNSLNSIIQSKSHLIDLVGDILDFSKLRANKIIKKNERTDIISQVEHVVSLQQIIADNKNNEIKILASENIPKYILIDPLLFRQVLLNLVSNAIKFTQDGCITINVTYEQKSSLLNVSVIDTGKGIEASAQSSIFNAFTQADSARTTDLPGTGLGLNIAKKLSQIMGGNLHLVGSETNKGSEFNVCIKAYVVTDNAVHGISSDKPSIDKKTINKILVVDDVKENRFLLKYYLKEFNFEIVEAVDGKDALDKFKTGGFSLAFLDMQLPDTTGLKLIEDLKKLNDNVGCEFVAFTASSTSADRKACFEKGFSSFVTKPFNTKSILKAFPVND